MSVSRLALCVVSGLVAGACGSSGSSGGGGPAGGAAACVSGKLTLVGDLDGQPVDAQVDVTASLFQQLTAPHTLDVGYADGTLHLEWAPLLGVGQTTAATGALVMPAGAPHAGEPVCAGSGAFRYVAAPGGNGAAGAPDNRSFTLDSLSAGPTCPGAALAGSLDGCAGG